MLLSNRGLLRLIWARPRISLLPCDCRQHHLSANSCQAALRNHALMPEGPQNQQEVM